MLDFAVATHSMCTVENLERCARSDRSLAYGSGDMFREHAEGMARARVFTDAMHTQSITPGMAWPTKIDLSHYKMMLDVAGGSGAHSIGALQHWPGLKASVFEMMPVSRFVREYAGRYNLSDRLVAVEGDMWRDAYPSADLHFYSQVYHDWPLEKCRFLTEKSLHRCRLADGSSFTSFFWTRINRGRFSVTYGDGHALMDRGAAVFRVGANRIAGSGRIRRGTRRANVRIVGDCHRGKAVDPLELAPFSMAPS